MSYSSKTQPCQGSILVVDDEPGMLALFKFMFAPKGLEVLTASTGEEALALAQNHDIKTAFVDLHLRRRDNAALVQTLRRLCPHMTLIPMLCYPDDNLLAQIDVPATHQLYKPFDITQVRHLVTETCHFA